MAAGDRFTINLTGTKNGSNKTFTFGTTPNTTAEIPMVMHNGKTLKPSWHLNAGETITDLLRWNFTGPATVTLGIAPASGDDLWATGIEA